MIAQLKKRCGFAGLAAYCDKLGSDKARIIEHEGVCMLSSKAMAASLLVQARMNDRVKQFVGHAMSDGGGGDTGSKKKRDDEENDEEYRPRRKGRRA